MLNTQRDEGAIRFCCGKIETNQLTKCWLGLKLNLHASDVFFVGFFYHVTPV